MLKTKGYKGYKDSKNTPRVGFMQSTTLRVIYVWRVQGLQSARNRSLLSVNEDFERKHNAEIAHRNQPPTRHARYAFASISSKRV